MRVICIGWTARSVRTVAGQYDKDDPAQREDRELKEEMRRLNGLEARMLAAPDQQISLTDPPAALVSIGPWSNWRLLLGSLNIRHPADECVCQYPVTIGL